jgi:oligopeptide transport system permease protein
LLGFIARRVLASIPTLFVIITVSFGMMHAAQGGPFDADRNLPAEVRRNLEASYHLDWDVFPVYRELEPGTGRARLRVHTRWEDIRRTQYVDYLLMICRGDLGPSTRYPNLTVNELLARGLPVSASLGGVALAVALLAGMGAGLLAGLRRNSTVDYTVMSVAVLGVSVPDFVLAPLMVLVFSVLLGWLPVAGFGTPAHVVLPALCLGAMYAASIARLTRAGILDVLGEDYIRTARAKGLAEHKVILRHALRGAAQPVVAYLGPATARILTGSLVIELIFNIPGIGRQFVQAALNRDYTLVMGTIIVFSVFLILSNLLVDVFHAWLDPRVRDE